MSEKTLNQLKVLFLGGDKAEIAMLTRLFQALLSPQLTMQVTQLDLAKITKAQIDIVICHSQNQSAINHAISEIRGGEKTYKLPLIEISHHIEPESIQQALVAGVTEYIVPPFSNEILRERISNALKMPIRNNSHYFIPPVTQYYKKAKQSQLSLLVVDDVTENIEVVRGIIKDKYHLKAAKNAELAMKVCLSNSPPDLILLDIMMPDVDGLTLCKMLKHNPLTQHIAIIFVTAMSGTDDMIRGLEIGAVDYITKPIQPDLFLARIDMHAKLIMENYALKQAIKARENQSKI